MKADKRGAEFVRRCFIRNALERGERLPAADLDWVIDLVMNAPMPANTGRPKKAWRDVDVAIRIRELHRGGMLVRDAKSKAGEEYRLGPDKIDKIWTKYRKSAISAEKVTEQINRLNDQFAAPLRNLEKAIAAAKKK